MTTLIGYRSKYSNVCSRVVLITRMLPFFSFHLYFPEPLFRSFLLLLLSIDLIYCSALKCAAIYINTSSKKSELLRSKTFVGGYSVGVHLFPFRTEKLSSTAPMVLPHGGRVGRCQLFFSPNPVTTSCCDGIFFCHLAGHPVISVNFCIFLTFQRTFSIKLRLKWKPFKPGVSQITR